MIAPIDLVPGVSYGGPTAEAWEAGWEYVEAAARSPFSEPGIATAAGWTAARYVIRAGLALDLIERVSPPRAKPVFYRISDHAMPRMSHPGGPTHPTPTGPPSPPPPPRSGDE